MPRWIRLTLTLVVTLSLLGFGGWWLYTLIVGQPAPLADQCRATQGDHSVTIDPEQAQNAAIIAGVAAKRGLPNDAVVVALATAWQESGIRNLAYGDRDSLGLFQQRPSQDWGTKEQIMDPYYATNAFYDALLGVQDWQSMEVNDAAQAVQRSGVPDGYRKHTENARTLAATLTGTALASFSCALNSPAAGSADGLVGWFANLNMEASAAERTVTMQASSTEEAWSWAQLAVANANQFGVEKVAVGHRTWTVNKFLVPAWTDGADATTVTITVR